MSQCDTNPILSGLVNAEHALARAEGVNDRQCGIFIAACIGRRVIISRKFAGSVVAELRRGVERRA